jgi:hypothetical protein
VLGVESVAECVRHYLVRQHSFVPRGRQSQHTFGTSKGFV